MNKVISEETDEEAEGKAEFKTVQLQDSRKLLPVSFCVPARW